MPAGPVSLCLVPLFLIVPGVAWRHVLRTPQRQDAAEMVFAWVLLSTVVTSAAALVLAVVGRFSLPGVAALVLTVSLCGFAVQSWRGCRNDTGRPPWDRDTFLLPAALAVVLVWFLPPHEHVGGGWDPGVYVQTGVNILRTGSINYRDALFAALTSEEQGLFVHVRNGIPQRFPGFRIVDEHGLISPQFHHLYPCWLAVAAALGGVRWALLVNPLLAALALAAFFLTGRMLFGRAVGWVALALLAGNLVQIWFARFSTAEILAQFLVWSGLYCFAVHAGDEQSHGYGTLAGLCFGLALFAHISIVVLVLPLLAVTYCRCLLGGGRRDGGWLLAFLLLAILVLAYNHMMAVRYFELARLGRLLLRRHRFWVGVLALAALGLLLSGARGRAACRRLLGSRWLRLAVVLLLAGLAAYAYWLRPMVVAASRAARVLQGDSLNRLLSNATSLRDMAWWVTPLGVASAVVGAGLITWRELDRRTVLCWTVVMTAAVVFFRDRMIEPVFMFTLRRFVPVVIPGMALCTAWALVRLGRGGMVRRAAATACGAVILGLPFVQHGVVARTVDFRGLTAFCSRVAEKLPDDAVVVCDGYWLAAPLHFLHGKRTLALSDPTPEKYARTVELLRQWRAGGKKVYYLASDVPADAPAETFCAVADFPFSFQHLEMVVRRCPRRVQQRHGVLRLFRVLVPDSTVHAGLPDEEASP